MTAYTSTTTIQFPRQFQGFFHRTQDRYAPLLYQAREQLKTLPIPNELRPWYAYIIHENPQPSFMLLPLMYLGLADAAGGITQRHLDLLPSIMLAMEICAIMDDTTDRTPMRSGRPTFASEFGADSATAFVAALIALLTEQTLRAAPNTLDLLTKLISRLGALELWEIHHRYPTATSFSIWLQRRYNEVSPAISYALNSARRLHGQPDLSPQLSVTLGRIFQDVDDVVNIIEAREQVGENDDFKMGMVTHPLLAACEAVPSLIDDVVTIWRAYTLQSQSLDRAQPAQPVLADPQIAQLHQRVRNGQLMFGIPATKRQLRTDGALCIRSAPRPLRPLMRELVRTFLTRLPN